MLQTEDAQKILGIMTISFPNYKITNAQATVDLYKDMFADYECVEVVKALKAYIATDTTGFAPSIGQLINQIHTIRESGSDENPSAMWDKVMNAIGNATYGANEEFNKLPLAAQRVLGSASALRMMAMNEDFNEDVEKSLFMRTYAEQVKKQKQINRMPSEVKAMIENKDVLQIEGE